MKLRKLILAATLALSGCSGIEIVDPTGVHMKQPIEFDKTPRIKIAEEMFKSDLFDNTKKENLDFLTNKRHASDCYVDGKVSPMPKKPVKVPKLPKLVKPKLKPKPKPTVHTKFNQHVELIGTLNQDLNLFEIIETFSDSDKLIKAMLPKGLQGIETDKLKESFVQDVQDIKEKLYILQQDPTVNILLHYPYDKLPFDRFIKALKQEDKLRTIIYGSMIAAALKPLIEEAKASNVWSELEQALRIDRSLEELNQILKNTSWDGKGFKRKAYVKGQSSTYASMNFNNKVTVEQAKLLKAQGKGAGGITYNLNNILELDISAGYSLDYTLEDTDAFQIMYKRLGFGFNKTSFEQGYEEHAIAFKDFKLKETEIDTEETGTRTLTHIFLKHKGKRKLFIDLGIETSDSVIEDKVNETKTKKQTQDKLVNLLLSQTFGNYTPFISLKDKDKNLGFYINSEMLTARVATDKEVEIYVKFKTKDKEKLVNYMQQIEELKHSLFPGSINKIEELRQKINRDIGGIMLKYAQHLETKQYSILLGKRKLSLEAGQTIDDWVKTNFARLNLKGINFTAEYGKNIKDGLKTQRYKIDLPAQFGSAGAYFLDFERSVTEDDRPAMNVRFRKTIRF